MTEIKFIVENRNLLIDKINILQNKITCIVSDVSVELRDAVSIFSEKINTKLNIIENKFNIQQEDLENLKIELKSKKFDESNFNNVSILKNQSKQIVEKDTKIKELESRIRYLENKSVKTDTFNAIPSAVIPIIESTVNAATAIDKKPKGRVIKKKTIEIENEVSNIEIPIEINNISIEIPVLETHTPAPVPVPVILEILETPDLKKKVIKKKKAIIANANIEHIEQTANVETETEVDINIEQKLDLDVELNIEPEPVLQPVLQPVNTISKTKIKKSTDKKVKDKNTIIKNIEIETIEIVENTFENTIENTIENIEIIYNPIPIKKSNNIHVVYPDTQPDFNNLTILELKGIDYYTDSNNNVYQMINGDDIGIFLGIYDAENNEIIPLNS